MPSRSDSQLYTTRLSHHERLIAKRNELLRLEREAASYREYLRAWWYSRRHQRAVDRLEDFETMMDEPW